MRANCKRLAVAGLLVLLAGPLSVHAAGAPAAPRGVHVATDAASRHVGDAAPSSRLELLKVVLLTRHGIRAGTKSEAFLAAHSRRTWPKWPVAPGELTPHGAQAIGHMGGWLRMHYATAGLLAASGCPAQGVAMVWADSADKRTRDSGQAIMDGMFPGCGMHAQWLPPGSRDPLFDGDPGEPINYAAAVKAVRAQADPNAPAPGYRAAMRALQRALGIEQACAAHAPVCDWVNQRNQLVRKPDGSVAMDGPLHTAATLSEILLLEYAQGFPTDAGIASPATLRAVLPLHAMYAHLMRRTPYLAAHNAHALAGAIVQALERTTAPPTAATPGASRLLLFLGHDTNLSNISALLNVNWTLPDEPDSTAPDTTLAFELLQDGAHRRFVRVRVYYQTLQQLRTAAALDAGNPAGALTLRPPGCNEGRAHDLCGLEHFAALLRHADGERVPAKSP